MTPDSSWKWPTSSSTRRKPLHSAFGAFFTLNIPSSLIYNLSSILSNIAEIELENPQFLRIIAFKLEQLGKLDQSIAAFEKVLKMRGEEPQSYRDLALVLAKRGQRDDIENALKLLHTVALEREWDKRFAQIELTALTDANRIYQLNQAK